MVVIANKTYLDVASMVVTWWIVAFCAVLSVDYNYISVELCVLLN